MNGDVDQTRRLTQVRGGAGLSLSFSLFLPFLYFLLTCERRQHLNISLSMFFLSVGTQGSEWELHH